MKSSIHILFYADLRHLVGGAMFVGGAAGFLWSMRSALKQWRDWPRYLRMLPRGGVVFIVALTAVVVSYVAFIESGNVWWWLALMFASVPLMVVIIIWAAVGAGYLMQRKAEGLE